MSNSRLGSERWSVIIGPMLALTTAHEAVLAQSPALAAAMEKKRDGRNVLFLGPSAQDLQVFRRILQYLYSQKLPIATADKNERPKQQCEEYIMACRLELDVLQSLLVQSLEEKEEGTGSETFLIAARLVYKAGEAKIAFREMFKRRLHKCIDEEGLNTDNYASRFVKKVLASGGPIASDVGDLLMKLLEEKKGNASRSEEVNGEQLQDVTNKFTELQMENQEWKSKAESAGVQVIGLKMRNERMRSDARRAKAQIKELYMKNREWMSNAIRASVKITDSEKAVYSARKKAVIDALRTRAKAETYFTGTDSKYDAMISETHVAAMMASLPEGMKKVDEADVPKPTHRFNCRAAQATKRSGPQLAEK